MEKDMVAKYSNVFTMKKEDIRSYDVKLCRSTPNRLLCPLCGNLLRNPIQTIRGEVACEHCYKYAKGDDIRCPLDGEVIQPDHIYLDKAKIKEIDSLQCYCMNHDNGCDWKGRINEIEDHLLECHFKPSKCFMCNNDMKPAEQLDSHLECCEKWSEERFCLYKDCQYKAENVIDLKTHLQNEGIFHAMLHTSTITKIEQQHTSEMEELRKSMEKKDASLEADIEQLKGQLTLLMNYATDMQNKYDVKTKILEGKINSLEKAKSRQLTDSRSTPDASSLQAVTDTVTILKRNMADLDLRQQLFENTSMDGKLMWKIDNVSVRINKAVTGSVTALHSAPVFTSKYGYKFCARLYLNGDGIGRGTHASLFFVLMKSEYDNLLQFPFTKKVNFRLINQENPAKDIIESFIPDRNSSSFKKPTKEMNVASGCPMFVRKEDMLNNGFVKDDTLFIEISV